MDFDGGVIHFRIGKAVVHTGNKLLLETSRQEWVVRQYGIKFLRGIGELHQVDADRV